MHSNETVHDPLLLKNRLKNKPKPCFYCVKLKGLRNGCQCCKGPCLMSQRGSQIESRFHGVDVVLDLPDYKVTLMRDGDDLLLVDEEEQPHDLMLLGKTGTQKEGKVKIWHAIFCLKLEIIGRFGNCDYFIDNSFTLKK